MSNKRKKRVKQVQVPDEFHYQEMIQMAYVQMHVIDELMDTHLVSSTHAEIKRQLHKASTALYKVYTLSALFQDHGTVSKP